MGARAASPRQACFRLTGDCSRRGAGRHTGKDWMDDCMVLWGSSLSAALLALY